ncbi:MAG: hypothetical protein ACFHVJ_14475 [Aestuariibacter sp.]
MTLCITCNEREAAFLSKECQVCMDIRFKKNIESSNATVSVKQNESEISSVPDTPNSDEGKATENLGWIIVWLSVISCIILVFTFGKIETGYGKEVWVPGTVILYVGMGINGVLFGYLLAKVGKILSHVSFLTKDNERNKA